MAMQRVAWFNDFHYRTTCPACFWVGAWRGTKDIARGDLRLHKCWQCHKPEELIEPEDFEHQANKLRRLLNESERDMESTARISRLVRLRNVKLKRVLKECKRVLDRFDMGWLVRGLV